MRWGHRLALAGLTVLGLAVAGVVLLVMSVIMSTGAAALIAGAVLAGLVLLWLVLPARGAPPAGAGRRLTRGRPVAGRGRYVLAHDCAGDRATPGERPGDDGRGAPRAVAGRRRRRPRQPGPAQHLGRQGRRAPGVQRLDGDDDDGAVVRPARPAGPGVGQAARLARPARDQPPARRARRRAPHHPARARRAAVLPEPHQGPRPRRLLHRLGRARRHRAAVGRDGAPVRRPALRRRGAGLAERVGGSPVLPHRRRRARRGRLLGGDRRPGRRRPRRGGLGRRPQPAVARPRGPGDRDAAAAGDVRGRRLAGDHAQVRLAAQRAVRAAGRRRAAGADRLDGQPRVPAAAALRRRRAAAAAARRRRPVGRDRLPRRGSGRPHAVVRGPQPRRARPRRHARRARRRRRHPADGDLRVHGEGARARHRGAPAEPLLAAHRGPDAAAGRRLRHRPGRPVGAVRRRLARGGAVPRHGRAAAASAGARAAVVRDPHRHGPHAARPRHHAGGARAHAARRHPRRARGGRARGDRQPGRQLVDQPRRLGQQGRASGRRPSARTGSPTTARRSCTGGSGPPASTSSSASPR